MALSTFLPTPENKIPKRKRIIKPSSKKQQQNSSSSSWVDQIKSLLTCKQIEGSQVHDPSSSKSTNNNVVAAAAAAGVPYTKLGSSCSSICSFRDVVHGNTRVVHRADNSPENSSVGQETGLLSRKAGLGSSNRSSSSSVRSSTNGAGAGGSTYSSSSSRGMQFRKLSGCYECHMIVDPSRYPSPRTTICACPECGEVFHKIESLQHHQATRHAVSELGPEDSGRNIVEIIFKSSWLKKDNPICKIERILKVHNTPKTIQRFEDCRDAVKVRANNSSRKNPRCAADGNELLRFHCTSLTCSLGARGSTSLCGSVPGCGVCTIIRHGFPGNNNNSSNNGVCTTATSGRAHDSFVGTDGGSKPRAMLVCRVIAGRVKRLAEGAASEEESISSTSTGSYDSVAGYAGIYANLEELTVFNPRAILPCFVVIYKSFD